MLSVIVDSADLFRYGRAVLEDVASIEDPLLRAETAAEVMAEAKRIRDAAICEAAKTLSVRQIADKIDLGKSTINQIVRAGSA